MKKVFGYLLAKLKSAAPDQTSIALLFIITLCVSMVPLVLFIVFNKVTISADSVALATIVGGIGGPIVTLITLLFILLNNQSENQEKRFRQTLDFVERLLKVYTEAVNEYEATGQNKQIYDENLQLLVGNIVPYLRTTEPLFAVVMQHLKNSSFDKLQRAGLLSIMRGQLRPLIVDMKEEVERLDRDMSKDYNQIARRQLSDLDDLLDNH